MRSVYLVFYVTGLPFDESLVKSDKKIEDEEIIKLLKTSVSVKAAKKKKKAAEKAAIEETEAAPQLVKANWSLKPAGSCDDQTY